MVNIFTRTDKKEIVEAIRRAEKTTSGEIRVHVLSRLKGEPLDEAKRIFRKLGMHRTKEKNAVLILIAPEKRAFAIWGDEGIHAQVGETFWNAARDTMKSHFAAGRLKDGVLAGIESVEKKLAEHFPCRAGDTDELPDRVTGG